MFLINYSIVITMILTLGQKVNFMNLYVYIYSAVRVLQPVNVLQRDSLLFYYLSDLEKCSEEGPRVIYYLLRIITR